MTKYSEELSEVYIWNREIARQILLSGKTHML